MEISIPSTLISALFGGLFASFLNNYLLEKRLEKQIDFQADQQEKQNQITITLKLYEQYETPDAAQTRDKMIALFKKYEEKNLIFDYREMRKEDKSLHEYLHFFERVSILYKLGYLDKDLFKETLAIPFDAFYRQYISHLIRDTKKAKKDEIHWMAHIEYLAKVVRNMEIEDIETKADQYFVSE
ncbi:MAG: hypothetical protein AAGE84_04420 [Cyanobacteria bacterium P01_G01_bin.39]